ncbi:MAG TPA: glyoxylate/hydroxypyruvate reductase A [Hyphomicrobiaceae bacterium]|jgi:glyoxylate/hydroxypyruvate reductase A|nr:glyoxylate/hydroxypyruvate reductase A [Hyphomicrobiaceae bacterium]
MAFLIVASTRANLFAAEARTQNPELDLRVAPELGRPADIDYALVWNPPHGLLRTLPNLKLIVSVGAGVDGILSDPELPKVPIVRYVDPDLTRRMVEYVVLHVLYHHRRMSEFRELQEQRRWEYLPEPAAHEVRVGIMGLGVLGAASSKVLGALGYQVRGWSRAPKRLEGVACYAGAAELQAFLAATDILVVLLPLTPETRGIIDRRLLRGLARQGRAAQLPGPVLINAGRGGLQVDADIVAALGAAELYAASLDVFETEPLAQTSPLWSHPRVVITPHNAAESVPSAIVRYAFEQVHRHRRGEPITNLVDPGRGY